MAVIVSPIVVTTHDAAGNPYTELHGIVEYRDAGHLPTGEVFDMSAFLRRIEYMSLTPISGALYYQPRPVAGDYPGNAGSGRLTLYYMSSGIVTLNISGLPVQVLSGSIVSLASGMSNAASGRIGLTGSGAFNAGIDMMQILSGVAISGVRAYARILGY